MLATSSTLSIRGEAMRAYMIEACDGIDAIQAVDVEKPSPAADEVLVKVAYAGVNPVDWKIAEGDIQGLLPHQFPATLGWDVAGTVEALGSGVQGFENGAEVMAYARRDEVHIGTFAEYVRVQANALVPVPQGVPLELAAGLPLTSLTAWQALVEHLDVRPAQSVVVHAGAGGVGQWAIQMAKGLGAQVITTASSRHHSHLQELGADVCIDYRERDFASFLADTMPRGVDAVLDAVGGDTLARSYRVLRRGGRVCSIVQPPDAEVAAERGIDATFMFVRPQSAMLRHIASRVESGAWRVPSTEVRPMSEVQAVLNENKQGRSRCKVVLDPSR